MSVCLFVCLLMKQSSILRENLVCLTVLASYYRRTDDDMNRIKVTKLYKNQSLSISVRVVDNVIRSFDGCPVNSTRAHCMGNSGMARTLEN